MKKLRRVEASLPGLPGSKGRRALTASLERRIKGKEILGKGGKYESHISTKLWVLG
jgi:hypothetical protein